MYHVPEIRETDYRSLAKKIYSCNTQSKLFDFYESFSERYLRLNEQYLFSECFNKAYLYEQLEHLSRFRNRPLYGIPYGIKDVFNTKVLPTAMGSQIWSGFKAGNNARIVDEILDRGGIAFSKTTTAEFAVHYIDEGKTINPYNSKHITGTSSAGSAVAVSVGALPIALATQTAGSIIRPSSYCNVYGFKPTFGAIDRTGTLKTTDTLDTVGFIGSDIYGIRKTFNSTFQQELENNYYAKNYFIHNRRFQAKDKLNIGIVLEEVDVASGYESYVKNDFYQFLNKCSGINLEFQNINDIGFINEIHLLHERIYCKALSYYFKEEASHGTGVSDLMSKMINIGNSISEKAYIAALNEQPKLQARFNAVFEHYDFIVTPSTASVAPLIGQSEKEDTCLIWTFLGYPVINLPIFWSRVHSLPFGLQVVGPKYSDLSLLDFSEKVITHLHSGALSMYEQSVKTDAPCC